MLQSVDGFCTGSGRGGIESQQDSIVIISDDRVLRLVGEARTRREDTLRIPPRELVSLVSRHVVSPVSWFMDFRSKSEDPGNGSYFGRLLAVSLGDSRNTTLSRGLGCGAQETPI